MLHIHDEVKSIIDALDSIARGISIQGIPDYITDVSREIIRTIQDTWLNEVSGADPRRARLRADTQDGQLDIALDILELRLVNPMLHAEEVLKHLELVPNASRNRPFQLIGFPESDFSPDLIRARAVIARELAKLINELRPGPKPTPGGSTPSPTPGPRGPSFSTAPIRQSSNSRLGDASFVTTTPRASNEPELATEFTLSIEEEDKDKNANTRSIRIG